MFVKGFRERCFVNAFRAPVLNLFVGDPFGEQARSNDRFTGVA